MSDALPLERLQGGAEALPSLDPIQHSLGGGDRAVDRERIFERETSVWPGPAHVDAELLDDLAPDLGHRHFEAHLIEPADGERIDDFSARAVGVCARAAGSASTAAPDRNGDGSGPGRRRRGRIVDEAGGDIERLLGLLGRRDRSGEDDLVGDGADVDLIPRNRGVEQRGQFADVAADGDFDGRYFSTVSRQGENGGLAVGDAGYVNAPGGAHDRIGDLRFADIDLAGFLGQVDDHRLADAQLEVPGRRIGRAAQSKGIAGVRGADHRSRGNRQEGGGGPDGEPRSALHPIGDHRPALRLWTAIDERTRAHRGACCAAP